MNWLRKLTHYILFRHKFRVAVLIFEEAQMPFAYVACELCFYHDPARPLGVYTRVGEEIYRVVATDLAEGATIQ